MATYLQGVSDYIPQFQPFQPDLNFYANALQTKQNQYDTNYKALNNVYGQYFYADLTHGDNLKKKDELIKSIDFNLKRVSGLDLSLEQNVTQAQQVFKPFYEDKHLMKDMAWTKNKNSQREYGMGLKNSKDEKQRAQYWGEGIKAIDYITDEFKNSSLEETMNIQNVSYTPYVNVMEKAQKIAKDAGLSVETVDFSPDGKWIVKTKNGEQLIPKLSHLFEATLGSDPAVMDVYKTQAYVNRKDYSYSNAAQFGGDQKAAEMSYLSESYKMLKAENDARLAKLQQNDKVYTKKTNDVEEAIEKNNATPNSNSYLDRIRQAKEVNNAVLSNTENNVKVLSNKPNSASLNTGFENPYGDLESLRWKVDNAMASRLMQKALGEAANTFAYKDAKQDINANPFAVQAEAHKYRMQEVASANASRERTAQMKIQADLQAEINKERIATGGWERDTDPNSSTYGQAIQKEDANLFTTKIKTKGSNTDIVNLEDRAAKFTSTQITDKVVPYMTSMLVSIRDLQKQGKLSDQDIKTIFGNTNMTPEKLNEQLKSDPYKLITTTLGTTKLKQITNGFQSIIKQNYDKGVKGFDVVGNQMSNFNTQLSDYYTYISDLHEWRKDSKDAVVDYVKGAVDKDLKSYVKDMYDEKTGQLVSEAEFKKKHKNNDLIEIGAPWSKNNNSVGSKERGKMIKTGGKYVYVTANNIDDVIKEDGKYYVDNNTLTGAQIKKQSENLGIYSDQSKSKNLDSNKKYIKDGNSWVEITPSNKEYFYKKIGKNNLTGKYGQLSEVDLSKTSSSIYNQLKKEIHAAYGSTGVKFNSDPPFLSSVGKFKDAGLTTIGEHGVNVYPDDKSSVGAYSWTSFKKDINNLDLDSDVDISFAGPTKTATRRNKEGKMLIQEMFNETSKQGGTFKGFRLAAQPLAQNKAGKGAMVIYPDAEWLKKHIYTESGTGETYKKGTGIISSDLARYIAENGISITADENKWNNNVYQMTKTTPFEAHVNYSKKPVIVDDPNDDSGMNNISFKKDDILGGYSYELNFKQWDPQNNKYILKTVNDNISTGLDLENIRTEAPLYWQTTTKSNNELFNSNK